MSHDASDDVGPVGLDSSSVNINQDAANGQGLQRLDTENPLADQPAGATTPPRVNTAEHDVLAWLFSISSLSLTTNIVAVRWKISLLLLLGVATYLLVQRPPTLSIGTTFTYFLAVDALLEVMSSVLLMWHYKRQNLLHAMWGPRVLENQHRPEILKVPILKDLAIYSAMRVTSFVLVIVLRWVPFISELAAFTSLAQGFSYNKIVKELSRDNFGHTEVDQNTRVGKLVQTHNKAGCFRLFCSIKLPQQGTFLAFTIAETVLIYLCKDEISLQRFDLSVLDSIPEVFTQRPGVPGVLALVLVCFMAAAVGFFMLVIPTAITLCSCLLGACSCWREENVSLHGLQLTRAFEKALGLLATTSVLKIATFGYGIRRVLWKMHIYQTAIAANKEQGVYHSVYEATQMRLALGVFIKEQEMYIEILQVVCVVAIIYLVLVNIPLNFWLQTKISLEYGIELHQSLLLITARQPAPLQIAHVEIQPEVQRQTSPELLVLDTPYYLTLKRVNKTYFEFENNRPLFTGGSGESSDSQSVVSDPRSSHYIGPEGVSLKSGHSQELTQVGKPEAPQDASQSGQATPQEASLCAICISQSEQTVIGPCGHGGVCLSCIRDSWRQNHLCPFCRRPMQKVYVFADKQPSTPGRYLVVQELVRTRHDDSRGLQQ